MQKVYIETTLFNFYFAETRGQYHGKTVGYCRDTRCFFEAVKAGRLEPYTSEYVMREIKSCRNVEYREEMLKLITDFGVYILPTDTREERLAAQYIEAGAISAKCWDDALHIAAATVHGLDLIVSLNFGHIVKSKAIRVANMVNETKGYGSIGIHEPGEVTGDDRT